MLACVGEFDIRTLGGAADIRRAVHSAREAMISDSVNYSKPNQQTTLHYAVVIPAVTVWQ